MRINKKITTSLFYENGIVRISIKALELLGEPKYISLLINQGNHSIAYLPSIKNDRAALKVKYSSSTMHNGKLIYSCNFVRKIFKMESWNIMSRYQICGSYSKLFNIVYFNLKDARPVSNINATFIEENIDFRICEEENIYK